MTKVPVPKNRRSSAGFTLLELLIAMAILATLVAMMAGSLSFGATVWDKSGAAAERTEQMIIAQRFLRRQLAEARPLMYVESKRDRRLAFEGTRSELKFVTSSLSHAAVGGPYLVVVHLTGRGMNKSLAVSWRELAPDVEDFSDQQGFETSVLMDRVSGIEISYFGATGEENPRWQLSWEDKKQLPLLVRIRLDIDRSAGRSWPEFVAATRIRSSSLR